ncbi:MAG: hypothetical protein JXA69_11400, partial [Phycisphaerae bacterium]|nr:hypothetical protein [Phycisphaerae bacterium]
MAANDVTAVAPPAVARKRANAIGWWARVKYATVRGFLWGWARCFSLTGLYLLGQCFGTCEYLLAARRRRRYHRRLIGIYGDELTPAFARRATHRFFMRTRCDKLFYLIFDKLPREKILKRIRFFGRDVLDEA